MRLACLLLLSVATIPLGGGALEAQATPRDGTPHFWPADAAPGVTGEAPRELLGFRFGAGRAPTLRACRSAGHAVIEHQDGSATCRGALDPADLAVEVRLVFCGASAGGRLCEARATMAKEPRPRARVRTYARALRSLRAAFGPPPQRRLRVDHVCLGALLAGRSDECLSELGAGVRHWWDVGGTEIFLALERSEIGPVLVVTYRDRERLRAISQSSD